MARPPHAEGDVGGQAKAMSLRPAVPAAKSCSTSRARPLDGGCGSSPRWAKFLSMNGCFTAATSVFRKSLMGRFRPTDSAHRLPRVGRRRQAGRRRGAWRKRQLEPNSSPKIAAMSCRSPSSRTTSR